MGVESKGKQETDTSCNTRIYVAFIHCIVFIIGYSYYREAYTNTLALNRYYRKKISLQISIRIAFSETRNQFNSTVFNYGTGKSFRIPVKVKLVRIKFKWMKINHLNVRLVN